MTKHCKQHETDEMMDDAARLAIVKLLRDAACGNTAAIVEVKALPLDLLAEGIFGWEAEQFNEVKADAIRRKLIHEDRPACAPQAQHAPSAN